MTAQRQVRDAVAWQQSARTARLMAQWAHFQLGRVASDLAKLRRTYTPEMSADEVYVAEARLFARHSMTSQQYEAELLDRVSTQWAFNRGGYVHPYIDNEFRV